MRYTAALIASEKGSRYEAIALSDEPRPPRGDASIAVAQFWFKDWDTANSAALTALGGRHSVPADSVKIYAIQYRIRAIDAEGAGYWKTVPIAATSSDTAVQVLAACLNLAGAWYHDIRPARKAAYKSMRAYLARHADDGLPPAM